MNKRAETMGSSVLSIYRVFLIVAIAFIVFGASAMVYQYVIDVKDTEALILSRGIVDCIVSDGFVVPGVLSGEVGKDIFSFCGFEEREMERFFVSIMISADGAEPVRLVGGDESLEWVQKLYSGSAGVESIERYRPGYFKKDFEVRVLDGGLDKDGVLSLEVIARDEM